MLPRVIWPGFELPEVIPGKNKQNETHHFLISHIPAAFLMKYVAGGDFTASRGYIK